jgi:hypothetical protein
LTPGIIFRISKNKYISAFIHGIIFSIFCSFFTKNLESFDEVIVYLDPSCNVILKDSDTPAEDTPMFLIQNDKCINMNDYKE